MSFNQIGIALAAYRPDIEVFRQQLESIQAQTFTHWQCVITLDSPLEPLRGEARLSAQFKDPRFIWHENPERLGHKKNFERAIQKALSLDIDSVSCSDQDDIWYPQKLQRSLDELNRSGPLSLVHCDMHSLRDGKTSEQTVWQIEHRGVENVSLQHLLVRNVVAGCSMLFDAELARRFPLIPDEVEYHDHWYAIVASLHGGVHGIREPLYAYRQHGKNEVGVTPFHSLFKLPEGATLAKVIKKSQGGWNKSHRLAMAVARAGLPLSAAQREIFVKGWDQGLGILALGVSHLRDDRPLARACFARGLGKALRWLPVP